MLEKVPGGQGKSKAFSCMGKNVKRHTALSRSLFIWPKELPELEVLVNVAV